MSSPAENTPFATRSLETIELLGGGLDKNNSHSNRHTIYRQVA